MRERIINIVVIIVVLIIGICGGYFLMNNNSKSVVEKKVSITEDDSINESIQKVYNATVVISNYKGDRLSSYGSGFVYKKDDKNGYIITNNHVVNGSDKVKIKLNNEEEVDAKILGTDKYFDIAVLSIDKDKVMEVAEIGDSSKSKLGDTIFTVGTPVSPEYYGTVTKGIVSGENREITVSNNGTKYMMEAIQIDASINPGNSGGPLVNINGKVIGVNSIKLVEDSVEGMGFAIPIEVVMSQINKLEKGETIERPVIGISFYDVSKLSSSSETNDLGVKSGVLVNDVEENSDAEKAGIKKNDVIIKIDGKTIKSSAHLQFLLYKHSIGDTVKVTVYRDSKEKELNLKLTNKIGE